MIEERAKKVKLLILDVDGVLTDGRIIYDNFGDELKCFNVQDGLGVVFLGKAGIPSIIITAKAPKVVRRRAKEMGIRYVYATPQKLKIYDNLLRKFKLKDEEICFIGDDILDLPIIKRAGLSVSPPNAIEDVRKFAHYITRKEGGKGAVREVCEILLKSQGKWEKLVSPYSS